MDQIYLLRQAQALAEHRHFARAADSMQVSQPTLTRGIAALERSLGVKLFDRTRAGVIPTAFGRVLLDRAESLLREHNDLRRELQLLAGLETGSLSIGAGPYSAEDSVAEAVARTVRAHPRLRVECTVADPDQVVRDVLAGRFDLGVARPPGPEDQSKLVTEAFPPLRAYFACRPGHPLTGERNPTLERTRDFPLVTIRLRGAQAIAAAARRGPLLHTSGQPEFVPQIMVNSVAVARMIARGSDALFQGTAGHLADDVAAGRLVRLDIESPALESPHGVFYLRDRSLSPAAREFIATLRVVESEVRSLARVAGSRAAARAKKAARR